MNLNKCSIKNCCSQSRKEDISFYKLPKNATMRNRWLKRCNLKPKNVKCVRVCSLHFKNKDFVEDEESKTMKLTKKAIPCVRIYSNKVIHGISHQRSHKREIRSYLLDTQRRIAVKGCLDQFFDQKSVLKFLSDMYNTPCSPRKPNRTIQKMKKLKDTIRVLKKKNEKLNFLCNYWKEVSESQSKMINMLTHTS